MTRFIAISRAVQAAMVRGGVDPSRIDIVYSGVPAPRVDVPRDWRRECAWPATAVLCGVVGAMTAEKGVETLVAVASLFPPDAADTARFVLLGGASGGRERIGGVEAFRAGFVDEVLPAMAGLDVLLHPSRAEGLGTAVIDAMALGVPPVAFAVGGIPELVRDDIDGMLVPPNDVEAFARAATRLITERDLRVRLASAGPDRAAEFGVDRMVRGTEAVYERVLGAARQ